MSPLQENNINGIAKYKRGPSTDNYEYSEIIHKRGMDLIARA
jgi:hypothetical protein